MAIHQEAVGGGDVRRLVAGIDEQGRTRILNDGPAPRRPIHGGTGLDMVDLWATDMVPPAFALDGSDPTLPPHRYFPGPGGTRFMINRIASASRRRALAATATPDAGAAFFAQVPGMTDTFEAGGNGMHRSHDAIQGGLPQTAAITAPGC